jgi:hypothetical protein
MKSANQKHEADNNWDPISSRCAYEPQYNAREKAELESIISLENISDKA